MASRSSKIIDVLVTKAAAMDDGCKNPKYMEDLSSFELWKELIPLLRQADKNITDIIELGSPD
jgi:hypothetical protein